MKNFILLWLLRAWLLSPVPMPNSLFLKLCWLNATRWEKHHGQNRD